MVMEFVIPLVVALVAILVLAAIFVFGVQH
jgi:hypothetical protein